MSQNIHAGSHTQGPFILRRDYSERSSLGKPIKITYKTPHTFNHDKQTVIKD